MSQPTTKNELVIPSGERRDFDRRHGWIVQHGKLARRHKWPVNVALREWRRKRRRVDVVTRRHEARSKALSVRMRLAGRLGWFGSRMPVINGRALTREQYYTEMDRDVVTSTCGPFFRLRMYVHA